jgi:lysine/ornithine N-monooxygenase
VNSAIGKEEEFKADVVVIATGFERPDLGFLEGLGLFPEGYEVELVQYTLFR